MNLLKALLCITTIQFVNCYHIKNMRINDNLGRELVYHGVNLVYKLKPWHSSLNEFNYNHSFVNDWI